MDTKTVPIFISKGNLGMLTSTCIYRMENVKLPFQTHCNYQMVKMVLGCTKQSIVHIDAPQVTILLLSGGLEKHGGV